MDRNKSEVMNLECTSLSALDHPSTKDAEQLGIAVGKLAEGWMIVRDNLLGVLLLWVHTLRVCQLPPKSVKTFWIFFH